VANQIHGSRRVRTWSKSTGTVKRDGPIYGNTITHTQPHFNQYDPPFEGREYPPEILESTYHRLATSFHGP